MAKSIARLVVSLGAQTSDFETDMKRAANVSKRELAKMERQAKQLNDKWNRNFKLAGAAVAAGLVLATKAAADFEKAMAEVSTLMETTPDGMKKLGDSVKKMSVEFGQAPVDQAKALYQIISAGASDAATQMEHLEAANKLAVGGVTDVATAADGLTTVLNAYAGSGMGAENVSDILFNTMKNGKTTIGELSQSIGNVATIASQTGVGFDQLGAAIGTLTKSGINTTQAMDAMRGVLSAVLKQSDQSVKMAQELGVEFNATALEAKGLHQFLADIAATGATSEQLSKLFGRVEGLNAVMALGAQDGKEFTRQLESMGDAAGATDEAVSKMANSTAFKAAQASAAFKTLQIEIGQKFLAAVSNAAVLIVKHIDAIAAAFEALVVLLTVRLGITGVAAIVSMTTSAAGLAAAMAFLGGPIGAAALAIAGLGLAVKGYLDYVKEVEDITKRLKEAGDGVHQVWVDSATHDQLVARQTELREAWIAAEHRLEELRAQIGNTTLGLKDLRHEQKILTSLQGQAVTGLVRIGKALDSNAESLKETVKHTRSALAGYVDMKGIVSQLTVALKAKIKQMEVYKKIQLDQRIKLLNEELKSSIAILDELTAEQDEYEASLQSILDTVFPLEKALSDLEAQVDLLDSAYQNGDITVEQYAASLVYLAEQYGAVGKGADKAKKDVDLFAVAVEEGIRILERSLTSMWDSLLSGSEDAFSSIKDGFRSLISSLIHQATTQKIMLNIEQGMAGTGTGKNGGINWGQLGSDLAAFAGVIAGGALGGGGQYANIGASIGAIAGTAAVAALSGTWLALGAVGGPIGIAIAAILGGLIGGLFDKPKKSLLDLSGYSRAGVSGSDRDSSFETAFGTTYVRSRNLKPEAMAEIVDSITAFDESIANLLDDAQLDKVTGALSRWAYSMKSTTLTFEQFVESRFATILGTFDDTIQAFVRKGSDLESKMNRLQVSVTAQSIMAEVPELFEGKTLEEFLGIVEGFQSGAETMTEAFQEVLGLLDEISLAYQVLQAFAGSDLAADFEAMMDAANISLIDAVAGMNAALVEAMSAFDGSPEQLTQIANMAILAREGELKLLAEIDALQKSISTNLEKLRSDILGLTAVEKTGEQLFNEAGSLVAAVAAATTALEVEALAAQFEALIRQMSPEDQARNTGELLRMISDFDAAQQAVLEGIKQGVIDNANATALLVQTFIDEIGSPLDILAATNQAVAESIDTIAGSDIAGHQERTEDILETGVNDIAQEVGSIGPAVARAVHNAVSGANFIVNVNIEQELVTQ